MNFPYSIDQPDLFKSQEELGIEERNKGIAKALSHAEKVNKKWGDIAYAALMKYLDNMPLEQEFMCEDFRIWAVSNCLVVSPPSKRAFGHVLLRAAKNNHIIQCGFGHVSNPRAHRANAGLWRKKNA